MRNRCTMFRFDSSVNKSKCRPRTGKLMDQIHEVLRDHHYDQLTEEADSRWIRWFIKYNGTQHPKNNRRQPRGSNNPVSSTDSCTMKNANDPHAWLNEHGDYLYRYAMSRLHAEELAQDMVQDTPLAGWKGVGKFAGTA